MRKQFLLGVTEYGELAFGEFECKEDTGRFSASFSTVRPFNSSEEDFERYCEDYIEVFDDAEKYRMCEYYFCSPQNLAEEFSARSDWQEVMDCSLYPETFTINEDEWIFESSSCGQHDLREDGMHLYTDEKAFNLLQELWDEYHLEPLPEDGKQTLKEITDRLSQIDEEEWIEDYIKENLY